MHESAIRELSALMGIVEGTTFDGMLQVQGSILDMCETGAGLLLVEMFPDTTSDTAATGLVESWERVLQIVPSAGQAIADRRLVVCAKFRAVGGLTRSYFEEIARGRGYSIGTHAAVGDPHLRITDGDFPAFRADYGRADVGAVWDQGVGESADTWVVRGTSVESDTALIAIFQDLRPAWTDVEFVNE